MKFFGSSWERKEDNCVLIHRRWYMQWCSVDKEYSLLRRIDTKKFWRYSLIKKKNVYEIVFRLLSRKELQIYVVPRQLPSRKSWHPGETFHLVLLGSLPRFFFELIKVNSFGDMLRWVLQRFPCSSLPCGFWEPLTRGTNVVQAWVHSTQDSSLGKSLHPRAHKSSCLAAHLRQLRGQLRRPTLCIQLLDKLLHEAQFYVSGWRQHFSFERLLLHVMGPTSQLVLGGLVVKGCI